jgi:hypothetical protein
MVFDCVCCDCDTKDEPAHIAALGDGLSWVKAPFLLKGKVRRCVGLLGACDALCVLSVLVH